MTIVYAIKAYYANLSNKLNNQTVIPHLIKLDYKML